MLAVTKTKLYRGDALTKESLLNGVVVFEQAVEWTVDKSIAYSYADTHTESLKKEYVPAILHLDVECINETDKTFEYPAKHFTIVEVIPQVEGGLTVYEVFVKPLSAESL